MFNEVLPFYANKGREYKNMVSQTQLFDEGFSKQLAELPTYIENSIIPNFLKLHNNFKNQSNLWKSRRAKFLEVK